MNESRTIKEAIVLAGGLGTRLRSVLPDLPKCMAPVAGKPFLAYLTDYFIGQGIEKFIFALGYKSGDFEDFLARTFGGSAGAGEGAIDTGDQRPAYELSVENEPLGTGGAIRLACQKVSQRNVLVLNGDTFFGIDLQELSSFHEQRQADCTLCLKPMQNFDRYGVVELGPDGGIRDFREKQFYKTGLINGGVYALDVARFLAGSPEGTPLKGSSEGRPSPNGAPPQPLPEKFSFEKDWLEKFHGSRSMYGLVQDAYFIDIGVPEDYERAQRELPEALRMRPDRR